MINKKHLSKLTISSFIGIGYFSIYVGILALSFIKIKKLVDSIKRSKQIIIDCQNAIAEITIRISEELARVEKLPRYQELESIMQNILDTTKQDRAFSYFLQKYHLNFKNYKRYCDLYLMGDFESFPFAYDHYHTEYYTYDVWIDDSHYERYYTGGYYEEYYDSYLDEYFYEYHEEYYDVWVQDGHYETYTDSYEVFDYREYFEVNGSMDIKKANYYNELYYEKEAFFSRYNDLCAEKSNLESSIDSKNLGITGKIFLIALMCVAAISLTILACYTIYKNIDNIKKNYNKLFTIEESDSINKSQSRRSSQC